MAEYDGYRVAVLKIAETQATQTTTLDLNGLCLEELPSEFENLTQLTKLSLYNNHLENLPDAIENFTRLTTLGFSGNRITKLPEWLGNLTQLTTIYAFNNRLANLPEWLGNLTQLTELDLTGNLFTKLPRALGKLTQLKELNFNSNLLTELPKELGKLNQLEELYLRNNRLTELPNSLRKTTRLTRLDVSNNELNKLPDVLGNLTQLKSLNISDNLLTELPEALGNLTHLKKLDVSRNHLTKLPEALGNLTHLESLDIDDNQLTELPNALGDLTQLKTLHIINNNLTELPEAMDNLTRLTSLDIRNNQLTELPNALGNLTQLTELNLDGNPLDPELEAAYTDGTKAVKRYLKSKAKSQTKLFEAKLILVGEGAVGKSCLLGALRGDPWVEGNPTTHGIDIKPVDVIDPVSGTKITLNGWDFGGQPVYKPTHQLFFSSPAVYLVVWKPREGSQQGRVKEWIKLIKHREPDAKIVVVATHGGPKQRQPDIDRQEIWTLFGKDTVIDFCRVENNPANSTVERKDIDDLKDIIARVAVDLPEMGRAIPKQWADARKKLKATGKAHLSLDAVLKICYDLEMGTDEAKDFVQVSHKLGHLIHYNHAPVLRDIVILKPDWLATAISFVLDDEETRDNKGLVSFDHLGNLWNDPDKEEKDRYAEQLHPVFLRLMERFDLSYRIAEQDKTHTNGTSLVAQLVSDITPIESLSRVWPEEPESGDEQRTQICKIVDEKSKQPERAEGLFYRLIVRLHRYSLGRLNYQDSVHWQQGLVLDDGYNGRAFLEHIDNGVRITVRGPYPEGFLAFLTREVEWLVDNVWEGLHCDVMVPCAELCPKELGTALFDVKGLLASKKRGHKEFLCQICYDWVSIDKLLRNASAAKEAPLELLLKDSIGTIKSQLDSVIMRLIMLETDEQKRFEKLDRNDQRILSLVDDAFKGLMRAFTDEAKEGPRLFSFEPVAPGFFDKPKWISEKFKLTLWCEHSRLPLPALNETDKKSGVYDLDIPRDWFVKTAPFLKTLTTTLSLVAPIASAATKLVMDDTAFKAIEKQLNLGEKSLDSVLKGGEKIGEWLAHSDAPDLEPDETTRAHGANLRQLHVWLEEKDPGFGGLVRVQNKQHEFLWVHPQFEGEY